MIIPRSRLLYWTIVVLPFTAIPAFFPQTLWICASILGVYLAIVIVDAVAAKQSRPALTFETEDVVRLSKDRQGTIPVFIRNLRTGPSVVRFGFPFPPAIETETETMLVRLPADQPASRVLWPCTPRSRGRFKLNRIYFESGSPLGFWSARSNAPINLEIRVYPDLTQERKQVAALFLNRNLSGVHTQRLVGQGRDFEKLREYIHGDSFDQIHWKATAKRGKPVTKVFQIERTQEVYIAIDYSRLTARLVQDEPVLEHFLKAALVLGMAAQRQGDLFGVITFADRVDGFMRARNGKAHYTACREMLAILEPRIVTPDYEDLFAFLRLRLRRRALIIVLTDLNDPILAESFVRSSELVARQHLLLVNMIRPALSLPLFSHPDAASTDSLYEKLAGHMLWNNLKELHNVLHRHGIQLSQPEDSRLTADLVSQYLSVKQRQQI
jgi:uncharacterized protein (DUF58 family)